MLGTRRVVPVFDEQAIERARTIWTRRLELLDSDSAVTVADIATATGRQPAAVRGWIARHRARRRIVAVSHRGRLCLPAHQFTDRYELDEAVSALVHTWLHEGLDEWQIWSRLDHDDPN